MFTIGLGSPPRIEVLGGRPGGGGRGERGSAWVSRGMRAEGVARLSTRELILALCPELSCDHG